MYKVSILKSKKGKKVLSILFALGMVISSIGAVPDMSMVYASQTGTTETGTTESGESKEDKKEEEQDILKPKTGVCSFWEWKMVTNPRDKTAFGDNQYHPVMLVSIKQGENTTNHPFLSSYSMRGYCFTPTDTSRLNNYTSEFSTPSESPEKSTSKRYGYYGKRPANGEEHSPSYYFNGTESIYYKLTDAGKKGLPESDVGQTRFFTYGDSMGVPWIRAAYWGPDNGRTMVSICFPKKQLTNGEAILYQPDDKDYYLDVRSYDEEGNDDYSEPVHVITHKQITDYVQDIYHLVVHSGGNYGTYWCLEGLNNSYVKRVAEEWASNIKNGNSRTSVLTMYTDNEYSIIPQGTKSDPLKKRPSAHYQYIPYIGTPHFMTSLESQTIDEGKLLPLEPGAFVDNDSMAAASDGIILPKGQTLTIDGGTVSVGTNFINNGQIVVKNGGTLIVKKGGCISPYTKNNEGEGTIKCDGGSVIIMEGARVYGFINGNENKYSTSNAPILLTGGGTLVNYGTLVSTYMVVGKGSKIENRKNGKIQLGYNRVDMLEMMYKNSGNMKQVGEKDYQTFIKEHTEIIESNNSFGYFSSPFGYNINTLTSPVYYKQNDAISVGPEVVMTQTKHFKRVGLFGVGDDKATIINEKTATFEHKIGDIDLADSDNVDIITPEY